MGYYINPENESKEDWLDTNGRYIGFVPLWDSLERYLPVCLVDNGSFTAAAICYDEREYAAFNDPNDARSKTWYLVPIDKLIEVCPLVAGEIV